MQKRTIVLILFCLMVICFSVNVWADSLLATTQTSPGWNAEYKGEVYLFRFTGAGPLTQLPSIPDTMTNDPSVPVFNAKGELFVANRHGNVLNGVGSISRFLVDDWGNFIPNGTITGNNLEAVHGLAFSPDGELFAVNLANGTISRFVFDEEGNAIPKGTIFTGGGEQLGVAFTPKGELFVTKHFGEILRYSLDPVTGDAEYKGSFYAGWGSNYLIFDSKGELFVPVVYENKINRFVFDDTGNPISNGSISVIGGPVGLAFSSEGELFVTTHFTGTIQRFTFDDNGNAIPGGSLSTKSLGGAAIKNVKSLSDTKAPNVTVASSKTILWPPNHKMVPVTINGSAVDNESGIASVVITVADGYGEYNQTITGGFGTTINLEAWRNGTDKDGRVYTITATATDKAGNTSTAVTYVTVPHDMGK